VGVSSRRGNSLRQSRFILTSRLLPNDTRIYISRRKNILRIAKPGMAWALLSYRWENIRNSGSAIQGIFIDFGWFFSFTQRQLGCSSLWLTVCCSTTAWVNSSALYIQYR
jgi:hypothetical protein